MFGFQREIKLVESHLKEWDALETDRRRRTASR